MGLSFMANFSVAKKNRAAARARGWDFTIFIMLRLAKKSSQISPTHIANAPRLGDPRFELGASRN